MTSTEQRQLTGPPATEAEGDAEQAPAKLPRLVVVHPDQVLQRGFPYRARFSLDGVVLRYMAASAAIVAALTSLTALGVALLGR